jgi:hypothetical protein
MDGALIKDYPTNLVSEGKFAHVPLIVGYANDLLVFKPSKSTDFEPLLIVQLLMKPSFPTRSSMIQLALRYNISFPLSRHRLSRRLKRFTPLRTLILRVSVSQMPRGILPSGARYVYVPFL